MLCTIYSDSRLYTIKITTKEDIQVQQQRNRSPDKFEALLIAIFREECVVHFSKKCFSCEELAKFQEALKRGKRQLFRQIFEKDVLQKFVKFPDKMYNVIHMGAILTNNLSCADKQKEIWKELTSCRGRKLVAISAFFTSYVKPHL